MASTTILVVEDDAVAAMELKLTLRDLGYQVVGNAASGEEAVRKALGLQPDLILMDITLEGHMDGIAAAAAIKKTHAIPLIYLTAHDDTITLERAKMTEPFGYLPKPCAKHTLAATIEVALYKMEAEAVRQGIEAELKRVRTEYEAELTKARNLEALGSLASGIAHDFNNLFQGLLGNISLAEMCTPEASEAYQYLHNAEQVYEQATKLTGQLIGFSTGCLSPRIEINPSPSIRKEATGTLAGSGLVADILMADTLWPIAVDPGQFRDVIRHLVLNAKEAMALNPGGTVKILAANDTLAKGHGQHPTLTPGNYVKISIVDQGCGISAENLPRIFDPYFSTKQRGIQKGMGLGLSLCDTIIKKYGGAITVETKPGKGSSFHCWIPAIGDTSPTEISTTIPEGADPGTGVRCLIMDDDNAVLTVMAKYLARYGYRIDLTIDGTSTITAYQQAIAAGDPYAVVILDLVIPGSIGGKEVVDILKTINPAVKAIVASGYADDPIITNYIDYGFVGSFAKPFPLKELKAMLERLL